jgi:hypothetical protein
MWHLAGIYLTQDWAEEYASWREAVDAFVEEFPDEATRLPDEISRILADHESEEDLRNFMRNQGSAYRPQPEDGGYREWLQDISSRAAGSTRDD